MPVTDCGASRAAPDGPPADAPRTHRADRALRTDALRETTRRTLLPAAIGLTVQYVVATVVHLAAPLVMPNAPLAWATGLTAAAFAAFALWLALRSLPPRFAMPLGALFCALVLANLVLYYALHRDPEDSLYFVVFLVVAGVFLLDTRWLLAVVLPGVVGWAVVSASFYSTTEWFVHGAFGVATALVAYAFHHARKRAIETQVALGAEVEARRVEAERSLAEVVRVQRSLEQSEADLQAIIASDPDGMLLVRDGTIVAANRSLLGFLRERDPTKVVGRPVRELLHPDHPSDVTAWSVPRPGPAGPAECVFRRADGEAVPVEIMPARPIAYQGEPTGLVTVRDITERHATLRSRVMLADRMVAVGTLAAGVAHEINNPLAYVLGNLTVAREELQRLELLHPDVRRLDLGRLLAEAFEGAERVRSIVADLKLFSRADEAVREPVEIAAAVHSAAKLAQNEIRHRARLSLELGEVPPVLGNAARLGQVFLNLLVNAAQAIPTGDVDAHFIRVRARTSVAGPVEVDVEDSGCGMDEQVRRRVFEPFFTTKPIGTGTGLGLAYCHNVISEMGGSITIDSEPGRGTRVRLFVPPAAHSNEDGPAPAPAAPAPRRAASGPPTRRLRVLVIDDEPVIRRLVRRALSGHEVIEAEDGAAGLAELARSSFEVVLCDLMMPQVCGSRVYARIRERSPGLERRIVFMTGGAFTPEDSAFLGSTDNAVVTKPFDLPSLRALVETLANEWERRPDT